jgi:MFS transporter, DHA3 family, multidrug efflux protein
MPATFRRLLANTLAVGVASSFVWFSLTFWVFVQTRSVVATGVIGAAFGLGSAALGPLFGTYVDRHPKHAAMTVATAAMVVCLTSATILFLAVDADTLLQLGQPWFWLLVGLTLLGAVAGQLRGIALATCVTLLVDEESRDRANGMVGTVAGASYAITSVFSGLVIGGPGMGLAYYTALGVALAGLVHLQSIRIEERLDASPDLVARAGAVDLWSAITAIRAVPGLPLLIVLAGFNNLLAGVFMALTDAYGLTLVSVKTWGLIFAFISLSFIAGGVVVARRGLGANPLRTLVGANLVTWAACVAFPVRSSIVLLALGMVVWLALVPVIEASEQTVLQQTIPFERQGRVFGFAQMVENTASPAMALIAAPLAERFFMPFMTDGRGANWIGAWFGTGPDRGIALMFCLAGLAGIIGVLALTRSRPYHVLRNQLTVETLRLPRQPAVEPRAAVTS